MDIQTAEKLSQWVRKIGHEEQNSANCEQQSEDNGIRAAQPHSGRKYHKDKSENKGLTLNLRGCFCRVIPETEAGNCPKQQAEKPDRPPVQNWRMRIDTQAR
ncbi:MAG: hypothetical protein Hens3KO_26190 [Henriciella sp.]